MTVRVTMPRPLLSAEAIAVGQVVTGTSTLSVLDGPTDQAGTAAVKPQGVATTSATDASEIVGVVTFGECDGLLGDTVAQGDILVAEYNTGRLIPFADSAYTDGTVIWTVGRALEGGADGQMGRIFVDIQSRAIATAPA